MLKHFNFFILIKLLSFLSFTNWSKLCESFHFFLPFHSLETSWFLKQLLMLWLLCPLFKVQVALPGYGKAATRAALPIPITVSVCVDFGMSKQWYVCQYLGFLTCSCYAKINDGKRWCSTSWQSASHPATRQRRMFCLNSDFLRILQFVQLTVSGFLIDSLWDRSYKQLAPALYNLKQQRS